MVLQAEIPNFSRLRRLSGPQGGTPMINFYEQQKSSTPSPDRKFRACSPRQKFPDTGLHVGYGPAGTQHTQISYLLSTQDILHKNFDYRLQFVFLVKNS